MNKINPIDFTSFKPGDYYEIASDKNIYSATVGDFRKGIAVAKTDEFDCLIDVNCRIVYQPAPHSYRWGYTRDTRPEIIRELGGRYRVTHYRDMSAPGKDSFYREWYSYINEDGSMDGRVKPTIPPYPMTSPYERGRVVRYENKFYDLETYKVLCEFPNRETFHISEFCNGTCVVRDDLYEKVLLVNVDRTGKIVSCRDVTSQKQDYIPHCKSLSDIRNEKRLQFERFGFSDIYADEFPCTKLEDKNISNDIYDELEKMANKSTLGKDANSTPGNLNDYHILYQWITKELTRWRN